MVGPLSHLKKEEVSCPHLHLILELSQVRSSPILEHSRHRVIPSRKDLHLDLAKFLLGHNLDKSFIIRMRNTTGIAHRRDQDKAQDRALNGKHR